MEILAKDIPSDDSTPILSSNGIDFKDENCLEYSFNTREAEVYFWTKKDRSGVVMEEAYGKCGDPESLKSTITLLSNEEFVKVWNRSADQHDIKYIEMVEPGVFKPAKGGIYTIREKNGGDVQIKTYVAKNEEEFELEVKGNRSASVSAERIDTPDYVLESIARAEEKNPDFLRNIYDAGDPFLLAETTIRTDEGWF